MNKGNIGFVGQGVQKCRLSNFENVSNLGILEPGPNAPVHNLAGIAEVVNFLLRTLNLTANNFEAL